MEQYALPSLNIAGKIGWEHCEHPQQSFKELQQPVQEVARVPNHHCLQMIGCLQAGVTDQAKSLWLWCAPTSAGVASPVLKSTPALLSSTSEKPFLFADCAVPDGPAVSALLACSSSRSSLTSRITSLTWLATCHHCIVFLIKVNEAPIY